MFIQIWRAKASYPKPKRRRSTQSQTHTEGGFQIQPASTNLSLAASCCPYCIEVALFSSLCWSASPLYLRQDIYSLFLVHSLWPWELSLFLGLAYSLDYLRLGSSERLESFPAFQNRSCVSFLLPRIARPPLNTASRWSWFPLSQLSKLHRIPAPPPPKKNGTVKHFRLYFSRLKRESTQQPLQQLSQSEVEIALKC